VFLGGIFFIPAVNQQSSSVFLLLLRFLRAGFSSAAGRVPCMMSALIVEQTHESTTTP